MLNAANLNFIAFWRYSEHPEALTGVMFVIFSIGIAAAEAAVGSGFDHLHLPALQNHQRRPDRFDERMKRLCRRSGARIHFWHMSHTITIRLNKELAVWLEQAAAKTGVSQGQLIRDQLEKAKASGSTQSFMQLAGAVRGPKDLSTRKGFTRK